MTTHVLKRFLFGILASLSLAAGFARAASHSDPLFPNACCAIVQSEDPTSPPNDDTGDSER